MSTIPLPKLASILAIALATATAPLNGALADDSSDWPGRTTGAGTRGGSGVDLSADQWPGNRIGKDTQSNSCIAVPSGAPSQDLQYNLVALTPANNLSKTTEESPTLFWYLPPTQAESVLFKLYETVPGANPTELEQGDLVYQVRLSITGEPGINRLQIPAEVLSAPLTAGQSHFWELTLDCSRNSGVPLTEDQFTQGSPGPSISGVIQRTGIDADLWESLGQVDDADDVYGVIDQAWSLLDQELWLDALATLVSGTEISCQTADSKPASEIQYEWMVILSEEGLADLSSQPFLGSTFPRCV